MGQEVVCVARSEGRTGEGKAHLDTDELTFRGPFRLSIPYASVGSVGVRGGTLVVSWAESEAELDLGVVAEKWAEKIRNPRTLIDKLGVKPGMRVSVVGMEEPVFLALLERRTDDITVGSAVPDSDLIFYSLRERSDLERLAELTACLKPAGAIWTVRPKGRPEITEADTMAGGKAAGLVDVKVARFSDTHTAEKFVIPLASRLKP